MAANKLDVTKAIFLAAVCGQTYAQFIHPQGMFIVPSGYSAIFTIEAKSLNLIREPFGFILESPQDIIIAFRGTSTTMNWISDLLASQKKFKYLKEQCLTHRGFTDVYSSARSSLLSALNKLPASKPLTVTGHSLGAALATLCAADIAANTPFTSPSLYTFGSPRVGDPSFAKLVARYVSDCFRIANPADIVTHAPPPLYKLPKREKVYYYSHVRSLSPLLFQNNSVGGNHVIGSYFAELAKRDPVYTAALGRENPGFCPAIEVSGDRAEAAYLKGMAYSGF